MKQTLLITFFFIFSSSLIAQKGNAEQIAAINKLKWLQGSWTGTSVVNSDGKKIITNIRETIHPALDGTILLIHVSATDKDTVTKHQSLAYTSFSVISYDTKNKKYRWTTWRNNGNEYDEYSFMVGANLFEYTSKENGREVRYKGNLGSKGQYLEKGEYARDETTWSQFITMELIKSKQK